MTKKLKIFALLAILLTGVLVMIGASSASAHTPSISASCEGVVVSGTNYGEAGFDYSITVGNNAPVTGHIGNNGSKTVAVPQEGATTTWSASIDAPENQYDANGSGSVGPCGEAPPPPPVDVCEDIPGNQPTGTDCSLPPPPHDECVDLPGNQPEGTSCTPGPVTFTDPTCENPARDFTKPDSGPDFFYYVDDSFDENDVLTLTITAENGDGKVVKTWKHTYPKVSDLCGSDTPDETQVLPNTGGVSVVLWIAAIGLIVLGILVLSPLRKYLPGSKYLK